MSRFALNIHCITTSAEIYICFVNFYLFTHILKMEYYVEENITFYSHILMVDEVTSLISQSNAVFRLALSIFNIFITNYVFK